MFAEIISLCSAKSIFGEIFGGILNAFMASAVAQMQSISMSSRSIVLNEVDEKRKTSL